VTRTGERGSATVWVLGCCLLLAATGTAAVLRTDAVLARHRVEAAADLAALAAAARIGAGGAGCAAARAIATANATRLIRCSARLAPHGRSGTVAVAVRRDVRLPLVGERHVDATARAGRLPAAGPTTRWASPGCARRNRVGPGGWCRAV
jgi:secretion/DNA translocation related TadE-like protein